MTANNPSARGPENEMWRRRCSLMMMTEAVATTGNNPSAYVAAQKDTALDLSELHVTFHVRQGDLPSPDNARIRVENLSEGMVNTLIARDTYSRVILQAGYWGASFGVIFDGTVKQFGIGRTDPKTSYLDIFAADGFLAYNYAMVNRTLAAGETAPANRVNALVAAMSEKGVKAGDLTMIPNMGGVILKRGKTLHGLARAGMRQVSQDLGATWNIVDGQVYMTPVRVPGPGTAVVLSAKTGLIGRAEQTEDGITAKCLINPRIRVGTIVQIDNASVNRTEQAYTNSLSSLSGAGVPRGAPRAQIPYDRYVGVQHFADVAADGLYRVLVAEYTGDTRGHDWYCDLTMVAVNPVSGTVNP